MRIILCVLWLLPSLAMAEVNYGNWLAGSIVKRYTPTIDAMTHHGWDHSNSAILHGIEKIYLKNHDKKYLRYIKAYADQFVNADGSIKGLLLTLDGMHPGVICLFLYEQTGDKKYLLAAKTMRDHLIGTPIKPSQFNKTPEGGYWHKTDEKYKNVMSVDGLYMAYPFLVHYAVIANEKELLDVAAKQILLAAERSYNIKANLPYHAWNYDKEKPWANKITGTSSQFWSRTTGWYSMALVDVLEYFPKDHPAYNNILLAFQSLAQGIKASQNPQDGLWYQVLDAYDKPLNYPETSGSAMIVYALQKGVNLKLIDAAYHDIAEKGWSGIKTKVATFNDGGPQINSVAPPMGSQINYDGYVAIRPVSVPVAEGAHYPHGYIGVLMAASVMEN
ncbi:unsaturated rhamnogalacturonyl hydrolase YteR [Cellvibrio zantedeschiae]|uniref:Unsaturated rhamnogalacturonyl hydrolase YteR n=1 Tax=Cellvibrio zantedeschiae TaxID=1237077 RepID=A0ABQ3BAR5_9GAMM|nr:glycoside hydrolase family 88 protein [Cellvibrio zantedeschiae]GGY81831.1 unsaturated rhamnogalacturonyl hydrolase YteR [Cellvibrio zantedeschiae]